MTVSTTVSREQYATDGVTVAFTIHFGFFDDTDINAIFVDSGGVSTTFALTTDFSVTGGAGAGGTLTTVVAPATGGTLTVFREIPFTQEDDYVENDPLPADTLESGFDRSVMRAQQLKDATDRALTFPVTIDPTVSAVLPAPTADQFLGWNALGTALENKNLPGGTAVYGSTLTMFTGTATTEAVTPFALASLWAAGVDNAGGATITLGNGGSFNLITSVVAITSILFQNDHKGRPARLRFNTIRTLTNGAGLIIPGGVSITTAAGDTCEVESLGSSTGIRVTRYTKFDGTPLVAGTGLPVGFLRGLIIANNVGDANHDIDIPAGSARSSDDTTDMVLGSTLTKQLDAGWAVGTNAGGLDTGAKANSTWYHLYLIKRPDTGVVDVLYSASASSPTMPANYTKQRRIGAVLTDGSGNLRAFIARGNGGQKDFQWNTPAIDVDDDAPGTAAVSRTLSTPLGIRTKGMLNVGGFSVAGTVPVSYISDLSTADIAPDGSSAASVAGAGGTVSGVPVANTWGWVPDDVWTDTASAVRSRCSASAATSRLALVTRGWMEDL